MKSIVWAVRDGIKKPFPEKLWERMPEHRWGWQEVQPEKPAVLLSIPSPGPVKPPAGAEVTPPKRGRKSKKS